MIGDWRHWLHLARLRFLVYSPVIYTVGAVAGGAVVHAGRYLLGLGFIYLAHAATHFFNEYFDYEFDVRNVAATRWTGGSRVLVEGLLSRVDALVAGVVTTVLAAVLLVFMPEGAALVGVVVLFVAWSYSGPPLALERRALGELTVAVVVSVLVPVLGAQLQGGVPSSLWYVVGPLAAVQFARMLVMNLADLEPDRDTGKTTLVVLLGRMRAVRLHWTVTGAAYLSMLLFTVLGRVPASVGVLILSTVPIGVWVSLRLEPGLSSHHNGLCMALALLGLLIAHPDAGPVTLYPFLVLMLALTTRVVTGASPRLELGRPDDAIR